MNATETKWVRLGDYIELCNERNDKGLYGPADVMGMTITKEIIPTKADVKNTELKKILVVYPQAFVYNPRTHGKKIGLGYNQTTTPFLISWNNTAFRVKDTSALIPDYLYMLICRDEWDRNACFRSWGSSTEVFSWTEFGLMEIPLPSIEVQRELVETYHGLKALAEQTETLVASLSKMCEALVVESGKKYLRGNVSDLMVIDDELNSLDKDYPFMGININKEFMPSVANTEGLNRKKYKVMTAGKFVFSGMQTGRDVCIRIGLYNSKAPALVSPAYTTFKIKNEDIIIPEYFFMQFKRGESDRLGWFYSDSSIRSNLDWDRFGEITIPLPPIEMQQSIVNLYHCMEEAKSIASTAREKLKTLCPALVLKGANA
ncbi:MAG: restriction endonuclease subunit S [Paraprevotella sp.]|nr:restriction endonuclease subunit S [Paraprevotella sp.]